MLHAVYVQDGTKYHQLILPTEFRAQAMELLHNQQGHQAVEHMLQLVCERFYWSTLLQDVTSWVKIASVPTGIHSDQGKSFDNKIIEQLCKFYGVKQSTTTPYNPHNNSPCKRLNCML